MLFCKHNNITHSSEIRMVFMQAFFQNIKKTRGAEIIPYKCTAFGEVISSISFSSNSKLGWDSHIGTVKCNCQTIKQQTKEGRQKTNYTIHVFSIFLVFKYLQEVLAQFVKFELPSTFSQNGAAFWWKVIANSLQICIVVDFAYCGGIVFIWIYSSKVQVLTVLPTYAMVMGICSKL